MDAVRPEEHLGLVRQVAHSIQRSRPLPPGWDMDDVLSTGAIGLVQAAQHFDPARGYRFSSYAVPAIRNAILMAMRSEVPSGYRTLDRDSWPEVRSLDAPLMDGEDGCLCDVLPDPSSPDPIDAAGSRMDAELAFSSLTDRERLAIVLYSKAGLTQKQIGAALGISQSQSCRVLRGAAESMARHLGMSVPARAKRARSARNRHRGTSTTPIGADDVEATG